MFIIKNTSNTLRKKIFKRDFNFKFKFWVLLPFMFLLLIIDNGTKIFAENNLSDNRIHKFLPNFINFELVENKGSAYGQNANNFLLTVTLALIVSFILILIFLFLYNSIYLIGFSFIIAGSLSNLINRIWNSGYVTDFLAWELFSKNNPWFIFNIADFLICIGITYIIISVLIIDILLSYIKKGNNKW